MSINAHARGAALRVAPIVALAFTVGFTGQQPSSNCAPASGERSWMDTSRSAECRAQLALAAMTPDERMSFRGTNERLGLVSPPGTIDRAALSAWDEAAHAWTVYPGEYTAHVGSSSRDLRGTATFRF